MVLVTPVQVHLYSSNFIQTSNNQFSLLPNYYFDKANFFLKLPSQTLFSSLVAMKPRTLFTH